MRLLFLTFIITFAVSSTAVPADPELEFFETRIRPILVEHCYQCHAQDSKTVRGGLLLDSKKGIRAGGESGAAVVPGNPGDSILLSALKHESFEMPPDRKLPENVIRDFERWIKNGAADPREGGATMQRKSIDLKEGRSFWSFQPIRKPDLPETSSQWALTEIDRFIEAGFEANDLQPAPNAAAYEVLRRLYFGLNGLPPEPADISSFETAWAVDADAAVASVVDKLLASPRFGERWGRHWLDVTRFAESSGGGRSLMFPHAWRFRDYVIKSLNDDKPFDQFVREHIAGDLLPYSSNEQHDDQVTGVGYLTLGPTNYEQQDKELLRMEVVDEQIDTLGRTFLGLTLGCARCHDHKFDPIPTADYYGLAGIFRSTKTLLPGNVSTYVTNSLKSGANADAMAKWVSKNKSLQKSIASLKKQLGSSDATRLAGVSVKSLPGVVIDDQNAQFQGDWTASTSVPVYVEAGYMHDAQMRTRRRVSFETKLPASGRYHVRFAYSPAGNRCDRVPVVIQHSDGQSTVEIDQRRRPSVDGLFTDLGIYNFEATQNATVSINCEDAGSGVVIVDAVQFLPVAETGVLSRSAKKNGDEEKARVKAVSDQLKQMQSDLKEHEKLKPRQMLAMAVVDQEKPTDWHIHVRGGIRNLGPLVPRGIVSVAGPADADGNPIRSRLSPGESGRRELAEWLASPDNPLTPRVFVNRVWQHLIGEGIVRTPDNFGKMGRPPTHPELLDYLAASFIQDDGWSVKKLIRRIATSRVYRISAGINSSDPANIFLSRGIRRRLEAEVLRDAILTISGQLDDNTTGGLTINKLTQYDNGYDHERHSHRLRSVYVPFFRNSMLEFFKVFDIANSNLVTGRRTVSTLPSQSLYLLNSPFMLKASRAAAKHFLSDQTAESTANSNSPPEQLPETAPEITNPKQIHDMIRLACLKTLGRLPRDDETAVLAGFVSRSESKSVEAWSAVFQALFASVDFRYIE